MILPLRVFGSDGTNSISWGMARGESFLRIKFMISRSRSWLAVKPGFQASKMLELDIMNFIRKKLSPLAMPQEIEFIPTLPKTRSGKIMRRLLHAKEWGEEIGDTSTLEND